MSGNSGGSGPSINPFGARDNCHELVINTNLASPNANVIATIAVGAVLRVQIASGQGPIQVVNANGDIAGNIVSREQLRLLGCIVSGSEFVAEVLSIDEGQCQVQIRSV